MGSKRKPKSPPETVAEVIAPEPATADRFAPDARLRILRGDRRHDDQADRAFRLLAGILEAAEAIAFQLAHRHPPACPCRPCEFLRDEARCPGLLYAVRAAADQFGGWLRQAGDGEFFPRDSALSADLTQLAALATLVEEEADGAAAQTGDASVRLVKTHTGRPPAAAGLTDAEAAWLLDLGRRLRDRDPRAFSLGVVLSVAPARADRAVSVAFQRSTTHGDTVRHQSVRYSLAGEGGADAG